MQTFLPYEDFNQSLSCLDYRRLGKQRVEAKQILNALLGESKGWRNHPATKMWAGFEPALMQYHNMCIDEWVNRGYNNNMPKFEINNYVIYPDWLGDERVHSSHRANLLRKDPIYYGDNGWAEDPNMPYYWPI
jgi:hypothetical protein